VHGRDRLATQGNGYVLHVESDELDALRFRALAAEGRRSLKDGDPTRAATLLAEALSLWRGELLEGVGALDAERARFHDLRLQAREDWFEAELELGRHADVVVELEHAVAEEPHRERLRELAMLALYRCGRQADALELYRSGRRALNEELGLEPSAQLRALEQAILRQDSSLELRPPPHVHGRRSRRPLAIGAAVAAVLVAAALLAAHELGSSGGTVSAAPDSIATLDAHGRLVSDIRIGNKPSELAVSPSAVWALNSGDGTVSRIDAHTLTTRTVGVGTSATSIAFGRGALWVGSDRGLSRIDPDTLDATPIDLGSQLSPHTGVRAPRGVVGLSAAHGVWVVAGDPPRLFRVDANARARREFASLVAPPGPFAYAAGALWSAGGGTVNRLDLGRGETGSVRVDPQPTNGFGGSSLPQQVAAGGGFVWATAPYAEEVVAVAPRTLSVAAAVHVPGRPLSVAYGLGSVWVGTQDGTVARVDPAATTVTRTTRLGGPVVALAVGAGRVWAAVQR
jgi:hypothetical protein